jgi:hypothetical protein
MQCHKALWLLTNRPELKDPILPDRQSAFDSGHDVGALAQRLFPNGVEVPFDGVTLTEQIKITRELIDSGVETIFEAAFSFGNVFVKADILHRVADSWQLWEVKASTEAKEHYLNDVAVQYHVISGCGLPVVSAGLVLINTEYVRTDEIEPRKLFNVVDVTEDICAHQPEIIKEITAQRTMLAGPEPSIDIGPYCSDPYDCNFIGHCWAHIPENSVFEFRDHGRPDAFKLYRQGIVLMEEVPSKFLGWRQQMQVNGINNEENVINHGELKDFLTALIYPLSFLDFETTCLTPVPLFDGTSPYQKVPFQLSLHIRKRPEAEVAHHQFLANGACDPRGSFTNALLSMLPTKGSIVTWNKGFEAGIIRQLAEMFPKRRNELLALNERMVDLMAPFRRKNFYHGQMNGSYSLKAVLPALAPELSYDEMPICSGDQASAAWLAMRENTDPDEVARLRNELLTYCHLDTLAMVKILDKIVQALAAEPPVA